MITFNVVDKRGNVYRVVEITAAEISKIEIYGEYYYVEEDFIIGTDIEIFREF